MSAICGAISMTGERIPPKSIDILRNAFEDCAIDRWEEEMLSDAYMRCGIQYFTPEAQMEQMPYADEKQYFNADVVMDNRAEVYSILSMHGFDLPPLEDCADGQLLRDGVAWFGPEGIRNLLGAYAFVKYDRSEGRVILSSDTVGNRYVFYLCQDGIIYYSSLMEPLKQILHKVDLNERWLSDFIGFDNLNIFTESEETPIMGIYRTPPAHYVEFTMKGKRVINFWNVKKLPGIRLKDDAEYKERFLATFTGCVKDVMRANGETGIFLSGGFDSTAVAAVASRILKEGDKSLYSFTSVPLYQPEGLDDKIEFGDETDKVKATADFLGNVECTFMKMPKVDGWTNHRDYMDLIEMPYKSPQNMLWLYEGYLQAKEKNVRILLGGMFGNGTISYENVQQYFVWLLRHLRFVTLWNETKAMNRKQGFTKKSILITTFRQALGLVRPELMKEEQCLTGFVNQDYLQKNGAIKRILKHENDLAKGYYNARAFHLAFMPYDTMRHYGEFAQKNSLHTGVLLRDPTRDPRIIEFCLGIPENQYTHNGIRRRLVREYMSDYMPQHIINEKRIGRQSADLVKRILDKEDDIREEWKAIYLANCGNARINCEKALEELENKPISAMTTIEVTRHIYTCMFLEYIDSIIR